jgi:hypothetical protein
MTVQPTFEQLIAALTAGAAQLTGRDGKAIRAHLERLAALLQAPDAGDATRGAAAAELEQLIAVLAKAGARLGPRLGNIDVRRLADGLRVFAEWLRAPSPEGQARVEGLVAELQGAPVPLDQLRLGGTIEPLAIEAARRRGLQGAEARHAVERMKREMAGLVSQLEARARDDAGRMRAATEFGKLIDRVLQLDSPLAAELARARGAIEHAFRRVDLAHMAEGLREFAEWLSTPADDAAAHVAALEAKLAEVLGPPTAGDPTAGEAERRAEWEREIKAATDRIFGVREPS